ncbi:hypothetical protein FRB99_008842 [Tulasnella sp. 403]|nr:hypothetical protein FRB99_008842 [Tulasnella sp. 403]
MNSTIPFLPDVRSRPSFHPSSPRDWLIVQAPLAILTLATRLALEPKPNPIAQATRFLLLPLGIYSVLVVCTSRDYSSGIPALNAYNYGIGLLGFVTAMKLIEVTFLKQPPKRVVALPRVTTPESDDTSSSGGNSKNGAKDCFREEVIPPSVSEAFAYLCDPRGISYDFGARAFQPPEWRDVNNRTTFLLSTLWRVILRSCAMDAIQVAFRMIPGTTIGSPQGGSIFIPSLPLPWRYVVSSAITIATGFCVYCGLNIGHDLITLFRVGVLGDDPSYYPPLFWRPWEAASLRELWSKRWHALFRNHLTVLGWSIGSALLGNVGGVLGVFTLSGILHDWTIWGMGKGLAPIVRHYATARQNLSNVALKPPNFGQPTPHTHPHLLFDDEVTPGIKKSEYEGRRRRLMEEIHVDDAVVVCLAAPVKYASGDIFYKYRQASDFWYLTGFQEPESALILEKLPSSSKGYRSTIFVRPKDPHRELWDGARTGVDAVQALLGVDQALPMDSFGIYLESVIGQSTQLYVSDPPRHDGSTTLGGRKKRAWSNFFTRPMSSTSQRPSYDELIKRAYDRRSSSVSPLAPRVLHMRAIKSEAEQRLMKAAGELSGTAHAKTMRFTEPDRSEADLAAHFEYLCALGGSERPAYVPVVASG